MDEISDLQCDYKHKTMIVTYKKEDGLENDTDDHEYQTPRLYRFKFLTYESSVIQDRSYANGHFTESNITTNDSYTYKLKDFDMIKAVADERAQTWPYQQERTRRLPSHRLHRVDEQRSRGGGWGAYLSILNPNLVASSTIFYGQLTCTTHTATM